MRKFIIFTVCILILLSVRPSFGITDTEKCKYCHGAIEPISKPTKDCLSCHHTHAAPPNCCQPSIRDPEKVHKIHKAAGGEVLSKPGCNRCHQTPVVCTNCHNSHENINLSVNDTSATICTDCHGKLPQPRGHEDFRGSLSENKHKWMTCDTCHLNPYKIGKDYKFELSFKDLFITQINDSNGLCKICHSFQYERLQADIHGKSDDKCVNCHNPHTTQLAGPKFQITPKETPVNISEKTESTKNWITTKIPILNNPFTAIIIFIVIVVVIAEYLLSLHEEGMKVTYSMIKVQEREDFLKTLEIKLKNQNIENLGNMLSEKGVHILGMTMAKEKIKEEDVSIDIYKYVFFVSTDDKIIDEKDEKDIIDAIASIDNVESVEFTDKYEL